MIFGAVERGGDITAFFAFKKYFLHSGEILAIKRAI